jgi:hypothetical protein
MDGLDSGASFRVHFLGAVRTEPGDDRSQRPYEVADGTKGRPWRASVVVRLVALPAVRADAVCELGNAVDAAVEAAEKMRRDVQEQRRSVELELEESRYQARLAARRYEAVDLDNRLVAAELEGRWNAALKKAQELEDRLRDFDGGVKMPTIPDKEILMSLAQDLPAVWNSPSTEAGRRRPRQ